MPDAINPLSDGSATSENSHVTTGSQHAQYVSYSGAAMAAAVFAYADKLYARERMICIAMAVFLVLAGLIIRAFLAYNYARFRTNIKLESIKNPPATPVPLQVLTKAAPLVLLAFLLTGCGAADPSLNTALQDAQRRVANQAAARDQAAAIEDQHLQAAQTNAIAYELQAGVAQATAIAKAKNLPQDELVKEIARQYHVAATKQAQVQANIATFQAQRAAFNSDLVTANAELAIVQAANSQQPVTATSLATTIVQALKPLQPPSTAPPAVTVAPPTTAATPSAAEVIPLK